MCDLIDYHIYINCWSTTHNDLVINKDNKDLLDKSFVGLLILQQQGVRVTHPRQPYYFEVQCEWLENAIVTMSDSGNGLKYY